MPTALAVSPSVQNFVDMSFNIIFLFLAGIPVDKVALLNQETRDYVGRKLLELTLKELFVFRFMQACSLL